MCSLCLYVFHFNNGNHVRVIGMYISDIRLYINYMLVSSSIINTTEIPFYIYQ